MIEYTPVIDIVLILLLIFFVSCILIAEISMNEERIERLEERLNMTEGEGSP